MGHKYRASAANSAYYFYILGEFLTIGLGYLVRDYQLFYVLIAVSMVPFVFYYWFIPESPRYLISMRRDREAFKIFQRIAKSNRRHLKSMPKFTKMSSNQPEVKSLQLRIESNRIYLESFFLSFFFF